MTLLAKFLVFDGLRDMLKIFREQFNCTKLKKYLLSALINFASSIRHSIVRIMSKINTIIPKISM
jgi:hypothetical protein